MVVYVINQGECLIYTDIAMLYNSLEDEDQVYETRSNHDDPRH